MRRRRQPHSASTMVRPAHAALQLKKRRNMHVLGALIVVIVAGLASSTASAFTAPASTSCARTQTSLFSGGNDEASSSSTASANLPQVFATGYSNNPDLYTALQQAVNAALAALPPLHGGVGGADDSQQQLATRGQSDAKIDLAFVTASSLYNASPATVVPAVLSSASVYGQGIDKLIGCTSGGTISSVVGAEGGEDGAASAGNKGEGSPEDATAATAAVRECLPVETEGVPGVSVTLALLPDVEISVSSACIWFVFIANLTSHFIYLWQSFSLKCINMLACLRNIFTRLRLDFSCPF